MTKFLKFKNLLINQDGKKQEVGLVYLRSDEIGMVAEVWNKHEVIIPNVVVIGYRLGQAKIIVEGNIEDIIIQIEEASVYE